MEKVVVGMEHLAPTFDLRGRLIGTDGGHLQYISQATGALVTLRGKGSCYLEMGTGEESPEPLHIRIEHPRVEALQTAKQLAWNMIGMVRHECLIKSSLRNTGKEEIINNDQSPVPAVPAPQVINTTMISEHSVPSQQEHIKTIDNIIQTLATVSKQQSPVTLVIKQLQQFIQNNSECIQSQQTVMKTIQSDHVVTDSQELRSEVKWSHQAKMPCRFENVTVDSQTQPFANLKPSLANLNRNVIHQNKSLVVGKKTNIITPGSSKNSQFQTTNDTCLKKGCAPMFTDRLKHHQRSRPKRKNATIKKLKKLRLEGYDQSDSTLLCFLPHDTLAEFLKTLSDQKLSQSSSNTESTKGFNVGILSVNFPDVLLSTNQLDTIQNALLSKIESLDVHGMVHPQYYSCCLRPGFLVLHCVDEATAEWTLDVGIQIKLADGPELKTILLTSQSPDDEVKTVQTALSANTLNNSVTNKTKMVELSRLKTKPFSYREKGNGVKCGPSAPPAKKIYDKNNTKLVRYNINYKHSNIEDGLKVAIITDEYPKFQFKELEKMLRVRQVLAEAIGQIPGFGSKPSIVDSFIAKGAIVLVCDNYETKNWLRDIIPNLNLWYNAKGETIKLKAAHMKDLLQFMKMSVWFPGPPADDQTYLKQLAMQNGNLRTEYWRIYDRNESESGVQLILSVDLQSVAVIEKFKWKAKYRNTQISFTLLNSKIKLTDRGFQKEKERMKRDDDWEKVVNSRSSFKTHVNEKRDDWRHFDSKQIRICPEISSNGFKRNLNTDVWKTLSASPTYPKTSLENVEYLRKEYASNPNGQSSRSRNTLDSFEPSKRHAQYLEDTKHCDSKKTRICPEISSNGFKRNSTTDVWKTLSASPTYPKRSLENVEYLRKEYASNPNGQSSRSRNTLDSFEPSSKRHAQYLEDTKHCDSKKIRICPEISSNGFKRNSNTDVWKTLSASPTYPKTSLEIVEYLRKEYASNPNSQPSRSRNRLDSFEPSSKRRAQYFEDTKRSEFTNHYNNDRFMS